MTDGGSQLLICKEKTYYGKEYVDELRSIVGQYLIENTIRECPIVGEYSGKVRRCDNPVGNDTCDFWVAVSHNNHVLVTRYCSW